MKKNIYPNTYLKAIWLLIFSIILVSPFFYFVKFLELSESSITNTFYSLFFIVFMILSYIKKKKKLHFNFKIGIILILLILILLSFQILLLIPFNLYLNRNIPNPHFNFFKLLPILTMAAVFEEFIFRGVILEGILSSKKVIKAVLFSAFLFGAFHFNFAQSIGALIFGLYVGIIYYYTRSIGVTMILHFFNNLISWLCVYLNINSVKNDTYYLSNVYGDYTSILLFISTFILILSLYYSYRNWELIKSKLIKLKK